MYELINGTQMPVREYNGQRVVTFRDIDSVHQRPDGTAKRNFYKNIRHFIEGVDFFTVCEYEIRTHKITDLSPKAHENIILLTLSGYLMISKSFRDDLSWSVQRMLVTYFIEGNQAGGYGDLLRQINELRERVELLEKPAKKQLPVKKSNAEYVLEKLTASGEQVFSKHRVLELCKPLKTAEVTPVLEELVKIGLISYRKITSSRGRHKEIIEMR